MLNIVNDKFKTLLLHKLNNLRNDKIVKKDIFKMQRNNAIPVLQ